jgi:2-hydroxy-3-oxopropionate reductase
MTFSAGFIGLGNQGKPIAEQLVSAGLSTTVYDISQEVVQALVDAGASAASSPREVGACPKITTSKRSHSGTMGSSPE